MKHQITILVLLLVCVVMHASAQQELTRTWSAAELFSGSTSSRLVLEAGRITLEKNILVEDDAPACGYSSNPSSVEILKDSVLLKKTLILERLPSRTAYVVALLYPDNPPEPNNGRHVIFTVNGHDVAWEVKHFWTHAPVPAEYLKPGENEVLLRVMEPGTRFKTWIALDENYRIGSRTRLHHPNRSARSTDGGRSWDDTHLGVNGTADGEYSIRLNMEAFQGEGWLESPLIDLAENSNVDAMQLPVEMRDVVLEVDKVAPAGTTAELDVRTGTTLLPESGGWSGWASSNGRLSHADITGRYLQFRMRLTSLTASFSPSISGARIHTTYRVAPPGARGEYFSVTSKRFPTIRSSFSFEYENPSFKGLQKFRSRMKLDGLVNDAQTEFEKMLRITGWVARQWNWHLLRPDQDIITWDANRIMQPGPDGTVEGGFCLHYAIVLMQALQSFGFPARIVSVDYSVWGGHEVVEVWSNQYGKWLCLDANFDTYFADRSSGVPLNVLELHHLFLETYLGGTAIDRDSWSREDLVRRAAQHAGSLPVIGIVGGNANSGKLTSYAWWSPPLELSAYCGGYGPLVMGYLRYMPRENYLSSPTPIAVNHGRTHWGWTGYYCWYDPQTPRSLEHSLFTDRSTDLYWNLNQIDFRALIVKSGLLRFSMASNSPALKNYELTVNGKVMRTRKPLFDVPLQRGPNRIEMRVIDSMGNKGSVSVFECTYIPTSEQNG